MNRYEILLDKIPPPAPPEFVDPVSPLWTDQVPIRLNNIKYGVARKNFIVEPLPESALPNYGDVF